MTHQASDQDKRPDGRLPAAPETAFKPVALPALAAAVSVAKPQRKNPKKVELPAILRKDAMLD